MEWCVSHVAEPDLAWLLWVASTELGAGWGQIGDISEWDSPLGSWIKGEIISPGISLEKQVGMVITSELWHSSHTELPSFRGGAEVEICFLGKMPSIDCTLGHLDPYGPKCIKNQATIFTLAGQVFSWSVGINKFLLEIVRCWKNNWKRSGYFLLWWILQIWVSVHHPQVLKRIAVPQVGKKIKVSWVREQATWMESEYLIPG